MELVVLLASQFNNYVSIKPRARKVLTNIFCKRIGVIIKMPAAIAISDHSLQKIGGKRERTQHGK
jgi:hypothetical protein